MKQYNMLIIDSDIEYINRMTDILKRYNININYALTYNNFVSEKIFNIYDVYIISMNLDDINGAAICSEIKRFSNAPIVLTANADILEEKISGFASGCDDYVIKDISDIEFIFRLKALFRRCYERYNVYKDIILNNDTKILSIRNKNIQLTDNEYKLMDIFLSNPNVVLTKDLIIDSVWGYGYDNYVLTTNINRLRNKIGKDKILTIKGVGYKFIYNGQKN